MKKKVVSLLICSALMMVEGVTTYAQTLGISPADGNKATIEAPSENKEEKKEKETSAPEEKSTEDKCKKTSKGSSKDDVEEKYVRDFLNCSIIDKESDVIAIDKIMFIYKYGSKKAKRIAVDEKLKMM